MVVNTRRLFLQLLPAMRIDTVCDIGSLDGTDALQFRAVLPEATVIAFEPHPENLRRMRDDPQLQRQAVRIEPVALSDRDGTAEFFLVDAADVEAPGWRGMSSLLPRGADTRVGRAIQVTTARLDNVLQEQSRTSSRIALWIDVEGLAHEVIEGAAGCLPNTHLLHVEVETRRCISASQRFLYPQVEELLRAAGFTLVATDQPDYRPQLNALFVRAGSSAVTAWRVRQRLALAWLRALVGRGLRKSCPRLMAWLKGSRRADPTAG